jgi:Alginate lyase
MNRRFAKSQSLLRCFVPCALPLVAANCALAPEERGHDDTFGETIAPLTAEQFYDTWKVQVNVGDGVYVNLSPSLEAEYSSQFFPTTDYTGLMMTIWNEDEALSGNRKPRVELRELDGAGNLASWSQVGTHRLDTSVRLESDELNGWERDIIVAQAHTDGTFDSGGSTDALAAAVVYRASSGGLECKVSSPSGEVYTSLQPSVVFGTYYKLRVEVNDAQARCAIAVAANSVWSYTPYAATQPGRMYFKTGNYTQPPLATAGTTGRTRVRIKGFATTH